MPSYNDAYRPPLAAKKPIVQVKLELEIQRGPKQRSLLLWVPMEHQGGADQYRKKPPALRRSQKKGEKRPELLLRKV